MLAATPELAFSLVIRRPIVSMIFQPPHMVPKAIIEYAAISTQKGIPASTVMYCPETRANAIRPMVFCASLAPCPKDTAAAETICSHLNCLASSAQWVTRCSRATRNIARNATVKATSGEMMIARAAFSMLLHLMASAPPADSPAPSSPPISAWLDDDGMPIAQVR